MNQDNVQMMAAILQDVAVYMEKEYPGYKDKVPEDRQIEINNAIQDEWHNSIMLAKRMMEENKEPSEAYDATVAYLGNAALVAIANVVGKH